MPEFNFFTKERMDEFWGYVATLLKMASPSAMIVIAVIAVGMVLTIAIAAFKKATKENDDDNENDDYEVRHY